MLAILKKISLSSLGKVPMILLWISIASLVILTVNWGRTTTPTAPYMTIDTNQLNHNHLTDKTYMFKDKLLYETLTEGAGKKTDDKNNLDGTSRKISLHNKSVKNNLDTPIKQSDDNAHDASSEKVNKNQDGRDHTEVTLDDYRPIKQSDDNAHVQKEEKHEQAETNKFVPSKSVRKNEKCIKRLPQAIIVGIQKSGTTALIKFLSIHPQIAACVAPIEPQYFTGHYNRPMTWYRNLMPCSYSNQITIEKSPPYFYRPFCADRIRKMNSKTKIIIIAKDPVERAISMYAMMDSQSRNGLRPFEEFVTVNRYTKVRTSSRYIDWSNYPQFMRAWLNNFKLEQILVLDGCNLERNPIEELHKVEEFLRIGTYFKPEHFHFNKDKGKYCVVTKDDNDKCLSKKKGRPHPKVPENVMTLLKKYFSPLNERFFRMIKQRLDWNY